MDNDKAILLPYLMPKGEGWEESAFRIVHLMNMCAKTFPGKPRILVLDIDDHRTSTGAFDHDAWVLQHDIVNRMLSGWFIEVDTPLIHYKVGPEGRRPDSDLPLKLVTDGDTAFLAGNTDPEDVILFADCRHCNTTLMRIGEDPDKWIHFTVSDGRPGRVGCRASSFDRLGDWDDSLDRKWKASPDKGTVRNEP